jgi:hypothetical protein
VSDFYVDIIQVRDDSFKIGVNSGMKMRNHSIVQTFEQSQNQK